MQAADLEQYLHEHIPLSLAMQVAVVSADEDAVVLRAPLAPNINHRETVFGGSASAVAILSAWALLHVRLQGAGLQRRLVIQRNTMDYLLPIAGDFEARATVTPEAWRGFTRMLARKGRARIEVQSVLLHGGQEAGRLVGEFVALEAGG
jgi:thioesterase domain-containing protein